MRFVIVTGMSGAGKSTALKMMEDMGYYCIDNLPIPLIPKLIDLLLMPGSELSKVALGVDIRNGRIEEMEKVFELMKATDQVFEVLYMDASDQVLIKRYKETRRSHPLAPNGRMDKGIQEERARIAIFRKYASYYLDTSRLLTRELRAQLKKIFLEDVKYKNMYISVLSFGFKYGIPVDADLVFDVRCLPNPYYNEELRPLSGNDKEVQDFVMNSPVSVEFLDKLTEMVKFLIPNYVQEGKHQLVIAIGCTGGKHRSVTIANALFHALEESGDAFGLNIEHRDLEKDARTKQV